MSRTSRRSIPLLLAIAVLWVARKPLHHSYLQQDSRATNGLAQALIGTSLQSLPRVRTLFSGYAGLLRYRSANRILPPSTSGRVIFYGDSITDFWAGPYRAEFFAGSAYLGRGISGQTTPQLAWRFDQDVLDLHPSTVIILAGTNDIIHAEHHVSFADTTRNLDAMANAAHRHGIRVILCSVLPVVKYPEPDQTDFTRKILALNTWLRAYATAHRFTYIDYFTPMATPAGALNPNLTNDGTHPNAAGYAIMKPLAQQALDTPGP
jgi:lysophospholipase L1-like esterase